MHYSYSLTYFIFADPQRPDKVADWVTDRSKLIYSPFRATFPLSSHQQLTCVFHPHGSVIAKGVLRWVLSYGRCWVPAFRNVCLLVGGLAIARARAGRRVSGWARHGRGTPVAVDLLARQAAGAHAHRARPVRQRDRLQDHEAPGLHAQDIQVHISLDVSCLPLIPDCTPCPVFHWLLIWLAMRVLIGCAAASGASSAYFWRSMHS